MPFATNNAQPWEPTREAMLARVDCPTLFYVGEADELAYEGMRRCAPLVPHATLVTFPGLDHGQTNQRADLVLPHLKAFLARAAAAGVAP